MTARAQRRRCHHQPSSVATSRVYPAFRGRVRAVRIGESDRRPICSSCGVSLGAGPTRQTRRTVTVLFADMVGSTSLGERLDPEVLRTVQARYFEALPVDHRAPRRDRREVHRRRGHGRLRDPDPARGRRPPGGPRRLDLAPALAPLNADLERLAGRADRAAGGGPDGRGRGRRDQRRDQPRHRRHAQHGRPPRAGRPARRGPHRSRDVPARARRSLRRADRRPGAARQARRRRGVPAPRDRWPGSL